MRSVDTTSGVLCERKTNGTIRSHFITTLFAALITSASLLNGVASADDTEIYFAEKLSESDTVANVLFMFDTSGSMRNQDDAGSPRIERLKRSMIDVVDSAKNVNIGIGSFNGFKRGGGIRVPAVGLDADLCEGATCNAIKVRASIKDGLDDGVEEASGNVSLTGSFLNINDAPVDEFGNPSTDPTDNTIIALRFDDLNIPRGATINHASVQLTSTSYFDSSTTVTLVAEAADDSDPLSDTDFNLSNRYRLAGSGTVAQVSWDMQTSDFEEERLSPDVGTIVSEIVSRPGWCGGNALTLLLHGNGVREVFAREGAAYFAPVLQVEYDPSTIDFSDTCLRTRTVASVSNGLDDVMEDVTTKAVDSGSDLVRTRSGDDQKMIGLRFTDLDVPANAVISSAYLQLTSAGFDNNGASNNLIDIGIRAEQSSFSTLIDASQAGALSGRTFTNKIIWLNVPEVDEGNSMTSVDISSLISDVVSTDGWARNGALTLALQAEPGATGKRYFSTKNMPAGRGAKLIVHYQQSSADLNNTAPVLLTGRDELIRTMLDLDAEGWTPLVDSYFEATQYMRGAPVVYGLQRGEQSSEDNIHRISAASSYSGADSVFRPPGCLDSNLNDQACVMEAIQGSPNYIKPAFGTCKANQIVLLSDGAATDNSSETLITGVTNGTCETRDNINENCGIELAQWMYETDHDDYTEGVQSVITHTVGFNISSPFLTDMADAGGGSFFEANSASDLTSAFNSIIQSAITNDSSFVAPTTLISLENRLVNSNDVYYAMFKPSTRTHWDGNLKRFQLGTNDDSGVVEVRDALGISAINDQGAIKAGARSFWSPGVDGGEVALGGAASRITLTRDLYTSTYDTTESETILTTFNESNDLISKDALGISTASDGYRTELLQWARGVDVKDYDNDQDVTEVRAQMGDPLHSTQAVINYESDDEDDDTPRSLIFMSTNHGFLHAINTTTGAEEFAFIPEELLSNLNYFYQDNPVDHDNRPYGLDGEISSWHDDANGNNIVDGDEKAYVYVGMRRGGRNYYALDVTDPDNPEFQWKIEGGTGNFVELGQTWSRPIKAKVRYMENARDVLFFAAGYDDSNDLQTARNDDAVGRGFYMVDAATGDYITRRVNADFTDMDYSIPSDLRIINPDGDDYADVIFVGDTGGQVWRFDIDNSATNDAGFISGTVIADISGTGVAGNRQFFYEPDIALIKSDEGSMFLNIAIGSGSRPSPNSQAVEDGFYTFRDKNIFGPPRDGDGALDYAEKINESDIVNASTSLGSSDSSGKLSKGWYFRFPSDGEKSLSTALTVDSELFFTTYVPAQESESICSVAIGGGRVYKLDVLNGDPLTGSEVLTERYSELEQPGIPSRVTGLIVEAAPDVVSKFVGLEAIGEGGAHEPFQRIFWAEQ